MDEILVYTGLALVALVLAIGWRVVFYSPRITNGKIVVFWVLLVLGSVAFFTGLIMGDAGRKTQAEKAAAKETTFDKKTASHIVGENP